MSELLSIEGLELEFHTYDGVVKVLAGVNLKMKRGDVLGLVGETGCGKSMTALSVARLIPMPPGKITAGRITFDGEDILSKSESEMEAFRARHLGMIFQDPATNLNPLFTIREQLVDAVLYQQAQGQKVPGRWRGFVPSVRQMRRKAHERAVELMRLTGIPDGDRRIYEYPHQFSGGMRQFKNPKHPYTRGLINAVPRNNTSRSGLVGIPGMIPNLINPPAGCRFHPRCEHVMEVCRQKVPPASRIGVGHTASCFLYEDET